MEIHLNHDELVLLSSLVKRKIRGWEWAIDEKKVDKDEFEKKIKQAKGILKKLEK